MQSKTFYGIVIVLLVALLIGSVPVPAQAQGERVVLAFYYGWYNGGTWGDGRLIDRPLQPYDSGDRGAMARQIGEAQSAGIDAFVMSFYGPESPISYGIFSGLLDQAASQGFRVAADVDLGAEFNGSTGAALNTMRDLIANLIHHPAYFRYQGKPVIFFWNQRRFSPDEWNAIRAQVDPSHDTIWVAEGDALTYLPVFDGLNLYNIAWSGNPASTAATWMQRSQQAGAYFVATAMPGWDDTRMGRGEAGFATDRGGGSFFRASFAGAVAANPHMVIITSWNEYFENTHIEPSQTYGTSYLDLARELIAGYKSGAAVPPPAPAAGSGAAPASTGIVAIPTVALLNVRQEPAASAAKLGQVSAGNRYPVLGRSEDGSWWLVDFGGGRGWIAAAYARYEGGDINTVPVSEASGGAAPASALANTGVSTGLVVTAQYNVRIRSTPNAQGAVLGTFPWRQEAELVGRTGDNRWLMISYGGMTGWVAADYVSLAGDVNAAPVTG